MVRKLYAQLAQELEGERILRKGWQQECLRVLEQNRALRRLIIRIAERNR